MDINHGREGTSSSRICSGGCYCKWSTRLCQASKCQAPNCLHYTALQWRGPIIPLKINKNMPHEVKKFIFLPRSLSWCIGGGTPKFLCGPNHCNFKVENGGRSPFSFSGRLPPPFPSPISFPSPPSP